MPRNTRTKPPSLKTVKHLFALSRNCCAFPQCACPIVVPPQTILGDVCHIKGEKSRAARYDRSQTPAERAAFDNLILLCKNHHKAVDDDPKTFTVELLRELKALHEREGEIELSPQAAQIATILHESIVLTVNSGRDSQVMLNSPGAVQATTIEQLIIKTAAKKAPTIQPQGGAVGHDLNMRNYALHLIDRYQECQKWDEGKQGRGKYVTIHNAIKRQFGMKWDFVPQSRFLELVDYLQRRILNSKLGRILNARGEKCFSTWDDWLRRQ